MSSTEKKKDSHGFPDLGKKIQRLRKAYNLSLGELSEQSGVAKSIISQLEKNETNPTLNTIWRISSALNTSVEEVIRCEDSCAVLQKSTKADIPKLSSEDGLCELAIIGWLDTIEQIQWYDLRVQPGGLLESEPHPSGTVEHVSVLSGSLEIDANGTIERVKSGETLRFKADLPHSIRNKGRTVAHATMVNLIGFSPLG